MKYLPFLLALLVFPVLALAQTDNSYVSLTNIPGLTDSANSLDLPAFLNNLYKICIGAAAVLAVLQIMRAGIMYMGGDSVTEKKEAKNLIGMAIGGLILVLSPVVVFTIINPDILDLKIEGIQNLEVPLATTTPVVTPQAEQTTCNVTLNEKKSVVLAQGQTCATTLGADWESISNSCCMSFGGSNACCGRAGSTAPAVSQTGVSYQVASLSKDPKKLNASCVLYETQSFVDLSACQSASLTKEYLLRDSEHVFIQQCTGAGGTLEGTSMKGLPSCSI